MASVRGQGGGKGHSRDSSGASSRRGSNRPTNDFSGGFPNPDDYCNSFWDENGYEALTSRTRQSSRTLEELKAYYKEKAAIEEDYAKRMNKLARQTLGKHEIGNLRAALDRIRQETARIGESHEKLAACIRTRLLTDLKGFDASREERRKTPQTVLEKAYKEKARQENLSAKAKDKYKNDCISINGLTAQTSLTQGRDLDKVQMKLEKHEATVQVNKNEYEAYTTALKDTVDKWNHEWKSYCDLNQDLEEERMDFLRISLWDYTNALSAICVADDESYEMIRKALERFQTHLEVAEIARTIGTGAKIRDPPAFVDYGLGHHDENLKNAYRTANFSRSSARQDMVHTGEMLAELTNAVRAAGGGTEPPTPMEEIDPRARSRAGSRQQSATDLRQRTSSQGELSEAAAIAAAARAERGGTPAPGSVPNASILAAPMVGQAPPHRPTTPAQAFEDAVTSPRQQHAQPPSLPPSLQPPEVRAPESTQPQRPPSRGAFGSITSAITRRLSRGSISQPKEVDPPGQAYASTSAPNRSASPAPPEMLANKSTTISAGAFRRTSGGGPGSATSSMAPVGSTDTGRSVETQPSPTTNLPPPDEDPLMARLRELRSQTGTPRTRSSVAAAAPIDNAPPRQSQTTGDLRSPAAQQPYDSRRASMPAQQSRPTSAYGGYASRGQSPAPDSARNDYARAASPGPPSQQQHLGRPKSPGPPSQPGYGGGAGRPVSPRPHSMSMGSLSRGPSANAATAQPGQAHMHHSQSYPAQASGAPLGIALDRSGQVIEDPLAEDYARRASQDQQRPGSAYGSQSQGRSAGFRHGAAIYGGQQQRPTSTQPQEPPTQQGYYPQQQQQPPYGGYDNAPTSRQSYDAGRPPYDASRTQDSYGSANGGRYGQQQPQPNGYGQKPNGYAAPPPQQQQSAYRSHSPAPPPQQAYPAPSPQPQPQRGPSPAPQVHRGPSPAPARAGSSQPPPTGQYSEGRPILFYVQALYDYAATIDEEFSFQAGDIIAVFQTDPDGWWQGELLDEDRKQIGGNTFPSNFTQLLS